MEKQKLKKMKILEATDEMVQVAENDVPIIGNMPYEKMTYPVGMLIRAEEEENIVKIGFFPEFYLSTSLPDNRTL